MEYEMLLEKRGEVFSLIDDGNTEFPIKEVVKKLTEIESIAAKKAAELSKKTVEAENQIERNIDSINVLYQKMKAAEGERGQIEVKLTGLIELIKQQKIAEKELWAKIERSQICLRYAEDELRKAKAEVESKWWIPFYNLSLLGDFESKRNGFLLKLRNEQDMIKAVRDELYKLNTEKRNAELAIFSNRDIVSGLTKQIYEFEQNQKTLLDIQKKLRIEMLEWQSQSLYYRCLKEKISGYKTYVEIEESVKEEIAKFIKEAPEIK